VRLQDSAQRGARHQAPRILKLFTSIRIDIRVLVSRSLDQFYHKSQRRNKELYMMATVGNRGFWIRSARASLTLKPPAGIRKIVDQIRSMIKNGATGAKRGIDGAVLAKRLQQLIAEARRIPAELAYNPIDGITKFGGPCANIQETG
jgi:hypothetical protein